jgi:hypothetical protein
VGKLPKDPERAAIYGSQGQGTGPAGEKEEGKKAELRDVLVAKS